jgi:hypothetical protein
VAAVLLGVGGRSAEDLGQELRDVARVVAVHVGEDRREDRVVLDALVETGGEPIEHGLPAEPLVECRRRGVTHVPSIAAPPSEAELQGSDGHGAIRLAPYVKRIQAGGINLRPDIRVTQERAATALIDGDNAMGHLVMAKAAKLAAEKARIAGIGWVGSTLSNHAGPASLYARMALPQDMIGLYFAVGNANHLPPWGGLDMLLSTNPIAVAIPARVFDAVRTLADVRAFAEIKRARGPLDLS